MFQGLQKYKARHVSDVRLPSSTEAIFCNTSTQGGWLPPPPWIFAIKPLILMILVLEDRYESPLSIDTKKVPVALQLTSQ